MAMSTSKAIQQVQRAHSRDLRRRHKIRAFEQALVRKAAVAITAGTYAALKRNDIPDDIAGFPWKVVTWAGSTIVEMVASQGMLQAFAAGVSDATAAIYMDRAIVTKSLVAGEGGEF